MTQAHDLSSAAVVLERALELICSDIEAWLELFVEDAVVEFPYASDVGIPERFEGRPAIAAYYRRAPAVFTNLRFRDVRIMAGANPDEAMAEAHGSATIMPGAHAYEQNYVFVLRTKNGKAFNYREYWNPMPALRIFGEQQP